MKHGNIYIWDSVFSKTVISVCLHDLYTRWIQTALFKANVNSQRIYYQHFHLPTFMYYRADKSHVVTVLSRNPEHWILIHLNFHFFWILTPCKKEMASINSNTEPKQNCYLKYPIIVNVISRFKEDNDTFVIWYLSSSNFVCFNESFSHLLSISYS